jgi:hypothetical protein
LHALRYFPFSRPADAFMEKILKSGIATDKFVAADSACSKTSLNLVFSIEFLESQTEIPHSFGDVAFRFLLKYYGTWLYQSRPLDKNATDLGLSLFLSEKSDNQTVIKDIFPFIENEELDYLITELTGSVDLTGKTSEILLQKYKNPLDKDALKNYRYFFSNETVIDNIPAYEIAFYSRIPDAKTYEGYIYISKQDSALLKTFFSPNYLTKKGLSGEILFTRTASGNEDYFYFGNDAKAGIIVKRQTAENSLPLTLSEQTLPELIKVSAATRAYKNLIRAGLFCYNQKIGIAGDKFELGSFMQTLSYNDLEGLRIRLGANTTAMLNKYFRLDGYVAYGLKDKKLKYRGDLIFPFSRTDRLTLAYVEDLNIPGRSQLDYNRDRIYKSFNKEEGDFLTLQKVGQIKFEKALLPDFALTFNAKYLYDSPKGLMQYKIGEQHINSLTNFEMGISLRFAPGEKFVLFRDNKFVFRKADIDINLHQRFGIKGIINSAYNYCATDFSVFKSMSLPRNIGVLDLQIFGGKFWNRAPFPLLFFPLGSKNSFIYEPNEYNLLDIYENITDQFVAANANLALNFSPLNILWAKSKIQTNIGIKTHYGTLSDKNNPQYHPDLFDFQGIVAPLGNKPYAEGNIGFGNILHLFRVDFVHRFGSRRNAVLFSAGISF